MTKGPIGLTFQGEQYLTSGKAFDQGIIVLPHGLALEVLSWNESDPPQPLNLRVMIQSFFGTPEEIAEKIEGVIAIPDQLQISTEEEGHDRLESWVIVHYDSKISSITPCGALEWDITLEDGKAFRAQVNNDGSVDLWPVDRNTSVQEA